MLETHDPKWAEKWDRAHAMMRELEVRDWSSLTADDHDRLAKLRRLLPVIFDASHRTPNEYMRLHLTFAMREAAELGLVIEHPRLPDDAGIDATRAAVAEVVELVEAEKRKRRGGEPSPILLSANRSDRTWWQKLRVRLLGPRFVSQGG